MMRSRRSLVLSATLLSVLVAWTGAFILPLSRPSSSLTATSRPASRLFSTLERKSDEADADSSDPGDVPGSSWETGRAYQVQRGDWFVHDAGVNDYSTMTEAEIANLPDLTKLDQQVTYTPFVPSDHPFAWARNLNAIVHVKDTAKVAKFYTDAFGMIEVRNRAGPSFSEATVACGSEEYGQFPALQFVSDGKPAAKGDGYAGATVVVEDVAAAVSKAKSLGGKVVQEVKTVEYPAASIPAGSSKQSETKAIVEDPEGNKVTIMQGKEEDKLRSVTLRVSNLEKAVDFYSKLGMKVLKLRENGAEGGVSSWVGYDNDHVYCMGFVHEKIKDPNFHLFRVPTYAIELRADGKAVSGTGVHSITVGVDNVKTALDHLKKAGAKVVKEPTTEHEVMIAAVTDADGYTVTLAEMASHNDSLE